MTGSSIVPALRYRDANAAIEWLCGVLGMKRHAIFPGPGDTIAHAELTCGAGMIMLGSASNEGEFARRWVSVAEAGERETAGLCLILSDAECSAAYFRAKAAGAPIVQDLKSPDYGGLSFGCLDPEGHSWWVGSYNPWATPPQATQDAQ